MRKERFFNRTKRLKRVELDYRFAHYPWCGVPGNKYTTEEELVIRVLYPPNNSVIKLGGEQLKFLYKFLEEVISGNLDEHQKEYPINYEIGRETITKFRCRKVYYVSGGRRIEEKNYYFSIYSRFSAGMFQSIDLSKKEMIALFRFVSKIPTIRRGQKVEDRGSKSYVQMQEGLYGANKVGGDFKPRPKYLRKEKPRGTALYASLRR